jgi:hypothetical protein
MDTNPPCVMRVCGAFDGLPMAFSHFVQDIYGVIKRF